MQLEFLTILFVEVLNEPVSIKEVLEGIDVVEVTTHWNK
jgi:hypothetical protein